MLAVNGELRMQYIASLQGPPGSTGSSGLSTYFVNNRIDSETESVPLADLVNVVDRNIRTGDILISSYTDTFGECAVVTSYSGVAAYLNYIGRLSGPQGPKGDTGEQGPQGVKGEKVIQVRKVRKV